MTDTGRRTLLKLGLWLTAGSACVAGEPAADKRSAAKSLKAASGASLPVDGRGFLRRWLVLEPIGVSGRLTMDEVDKAMQEHRLPESAGALPVDGEMAQWAGPEHRWHAVDTLYYNLNLYHFAWALSRPTSNVLFWVVAVVEAPEDMKEVRLAIGSNAASAWWLNGERVISLYNDRQSVIDDGVSRRVALRKGSNVIRAAIVNGGGATDFCARFLDAEDRPITRLATRLTASAMR